VRKAVLAISLSLSGPLAASPEQSGGEAAPLPEKLEWQAGWARFSNLEYGVVFVSAGVALGATLSEPRRSAPWTDTWGIDESTRDALRADSRGGRQVARHTSDALLIANLTYPILADGLLNAAWYRNSGDVAYQLIAIDLEVAGVTAALTSITKTLASRERPYGRECGGELDSAEGDCVNRDRYQSHFSGHTSFSFAAAAATCMHHSYLPLYGGWSPLAPCIAGYALAGTTGALRMVADRHYATDVGVGAVVGTAVGLLIPWLHYRDGTSQAAAQSWLSRHQLLLVPSSRGLVAKGVF
jgi:membrane-associated phospholipid phosphatase